MKEKDTYINAVKKADRELSLSDGFKSCDRPHKNKKKYDRKRDKKSFERLESLV